MRIWEFVYAIAVIVLAVCTILYRVLHFYPQVEWQSATRRMIVREILLWLGPVAMFGFGVYQLVMLLATGG